MVKEIRIYFEGDDKLRRGFSAFLKSKIDLARQRGLKFNFIAGGSTAETIKDFMDAARKHKDAFNVMLIDSDKPDNGSLIAEVKKRESWDSKAGAQVQDEQIHFMVQVMESWFLADRDALKKYYGQGFRENQLPVDENVERISGDDVLNRLANATRSTSKKKYHKTRHAPGLLASIDSEIVCSYAPYCKRLFDSLHAQITNA